MSAAKGALDFHKELPEGVGIPKKSSIFAKRVEFLRLK
jgi:hypothetical protein